MIKCDVSRFLNTNTNWSKVIENVVGNIDVWRSNSSESPCISIMNRAISNFLFVSCCWFKSNSCLECINLRTIENFNISHYCRSSSINHLRTIHFLCVTGYNLTSPTFNVLSINYNVTCKKNDLTSHIQTIVIRCCRFCFTPMEIIQSLLRFNSTRSWIIRFNKNIIRIVWIIRSW